MSTIDKEYLLTFARIKGWKLHKSGLYYHSDKSYKLTLEQIYREFR